MTGAVDNFHHDVAAARAAAGRGQRGEAEQRLRAALGHAEHGGVPDADLATALYELAALRRDEEDLAEAELFLQRALDVLDGTSAPDDALHLHALSALGSVLAARGESARAEALLTRALRIGERVLGTEHADLGGLLNDLSRLHLRAGAHAEAEPLLLRLYDMKRRSKGEEHPESATVLASLAVARQALGQHEDAESMWRRVLAVREQTLAPNHFATATALEHLAESCAARGKLTEAVQLLRRAVTMRERTLGASHPSLRVTRDRIADLRLQASDGALESFAPAAQTAPIPMLPIMAPRPEAVAPAHIDTKVVSRAEPVVTVLAEPVVVVRHEPVVAARPEVAEPAPVTRAVETETAPSAPVSFVLPAPSGALALHEPNAPRAAAIVQHPAYEDLMAIQAELASADPHQDDADDDRGEQRTSLAGAALTQLRTRRVPFIAAGAVAVVLLVGAAAMRSRAEGDLYASEYPAAQREPAAVTLLPDSANTVLSSKAASPSAEAERIASAAANPEPHPPVLPQRRVLNGDVAPALRASAASASAAAPVAPPKLIRNLESFAGAVQAPATPVGESTRSPLASDMPKRKFDLGVADGSNEFVRARLIGAAPAPSFPEILRDRKIVGDVVVRFTVDAQGRPDPASFTVIRTPHELMSEAVRRVIPSLRFEPAHKGRIGAPAEPDQVQMSFQFNGATD